MTRPDRDYDDILSRVLHSTLDPIEPAGDGLAKIQKRIAEPWLKRRVSLLRTELTALGWLIAVRCEPFFGAARSSLAGIGRPGGRWMRSPLMLGGPGSGRHKGPSHDRPADAVIRRWIGPTMAWLRPTLAVAGAVVIVVAGVFAMHGFNLAFSPAANTGATNSGSHGNHGRHGSKGTGAGTTQSHQATTPRQGQRHSSSPTASTKGMTAGSSQPAPSPTTSEPSPSPSPTSASPTASPAPTTPGPTGTPGPTVSATAPSGGTTASSPPG